MLPLALLLSYLCGAIPFGVIAGKLRGIDVRSVGSGNIGTTNVWRALGPVAGTAVFLLDVCKGWAAPWLGGALLGRSQAWAIALCAIMAVLGHTFSVFLRFRGGKGIATGLGVGLGLAPLPALATFALWGVVLLLTRTISIASVAACVVLPVAAWLSGAPAAYVVVLTLIITVALLKHIPNIKRMIAGTEPKIGRKAVAATGADHGQTDTDGPEQPGVQPADAPLHTAGPAPVPVANGHPHVESIGEAVSRP